MLQLAHVLNMVMSVSNKMMICFMLMKLIIPITESTASSNMAKKLKTNIFVLVLFLKINKLSFYVFNYYSFLCVSPLSVFVLCYSSKAMLHNVLSLNYCQHT